MRLLLDQRAQRLARTALNRPLKARLQSTWRRGGWCVRVWGGVCVWGGLGVWPFVRGFVRWWVWGVVIFTASYEPLKYGAFVSLTLLGAFKVRCGGRAVRTALGVRVGHLGFWAQ